jgi:hypothetical protein
VLRTSPGPDQRRASRFRRPPQKALPLPAPALDVREPIAPTVGKSCVASKPVRAESICMVAATLPQSRGSLLAAAKELLAHGPKLEVCRQQCGRSAATQSTAVSRDRTSVYAPSPDSRGGSSILPSPGAVQAAAPGS